MGLSRLVGSLAALALVVAGARAWSCDGCQCVQDNPNLYECCNNPTNYSDCYGHLKWGDLAECQAFCKPPSFRLNEYFNGSHPGPGCDRQPVCQYAGAVGKCTASVDGSCTDVLASCNGSGIFYQRFWASRDGSCRGPAQGPFGGPADGGCHRSGDGSPTDKQDWFVEGSCT